MSIVYLSVVVESAWTCAAMAINIVFICCGSIATQGIDVQNSHTNTVFFVVNRTTAAANKLVSASSTQIVCNTRPSRAKCVRKNETTEAKIFAEFFVLTFVAFVARMSVSLSMLLHTAVSGCIFSFSRIVDAAAAAPPRPRWCWAIRWMRRRETMFTRWYVSTYCIRVYRFSFGRFSRLFCGHLNKMCVSCVRFYIIISLNRITRAKVHSFSPRSCHRKLLFGWKIWNQIYSTWNFCTTHSQTDGKKTNIRRTHSNTHAHALPTNMRFIYDYYFPVIFLFFFCFTSFRIFVVIQFSLSLRINKTNTVLGWCEISCNKIDILRCCRLLLKCIKLSLALSLSLTHSPYIVLYFGRNWSPCGRSNRVQYSYHTPHTAHSIHAFGISTTHFSIIFISLGKMQSHLWMQRTEEQNTKKTVTHSQSTHSCSGIHVRWKKLSYIENWTNDGRRKSN